MRCNKVVLLASILCLLHSIDALAADWPHWRGPDRDGKVSDKGFDPAFANGGADIKWSADIGVGFTGVTVADGLAFTAGWANGKTTFFAFDAKTGEKKWDHSFATKKFDNLNVGGPSGTPAVDDGHVYHQARDGKMVCYKVAGGVVWERDLAKAYGVKVPKWGFSGSPVIIGDVLYLDMGKIIALNKKTGKEIWVTKDLGPAYSTPAPFNFKGKDYLAVFPATGLYIINRDTGKPVAHFPWKTSYGVHAATPVVVDNQYILISSEYNTGCAMLQFTGKSLELIWENKALQQKMGTSIYHDRTFYGFDGTKLAAVDVKSGKQLWTRRGLGHGTVMMAGETLLVLSDKGEVLTAKASRDVFKPITRTKLIDGDSTIWTAPTLANGMLYVRGSRGKLVAVDAGH